jgi:hypothetical protein
VKVRLLTVVTGRGNEGEVNAPSSIQGKLCSAAGEERATWLGRQTQARGAGTSSRTAGQCVHVQVVRPAGHSGDVRSVSGERERGNRGVAPVSGVSWRTKARVAAHREAAAYAWCAVACVTRGRQTRARGHYGQAGGMPECHIS